MNARAPRHSGFTLLELALAMTLLAVLAAKSVMVLSEGMTRTGEDTAETMLEEQARTVLRRIAEAIMSSDRDTLNPAAEAPLTTEDVRYRVHLGVQEGEVVWSDPQQIALAVGEDEIFWARNPETADQLRVVWTRLVAPYLEGELPDGMDNNGNGLIDERGLSFDFDRNSVTIRMTLDRITPDGRALTKTLETTVTCRNVPNVSKGPGRR